MRRSRIGIRRRRKKANIIIVLLFLFVLPMIAVKVGSKITERWVVPTINTDDILKSPEGVIVEEDNADKDDVQEKTNNTDHDGEENRSDKKTINLNPVSVHVIQIASVSDSKNIELLIEELSNHNLPHVTYKLDDTYKIYAFASTDRKNMEDKIDRVKEVYEDAYIGQIHVPQKEIRYSDEKNKGTKEIVEDMNSLLKLLKESSDSLHGHGDREEKLDEYKGILNKYQQLLDGMSKKISDADLPENFADTDSIKKMIKYQKKNITNSLEIIKAGQDSYRLQNYFLDNLFRTIEIIKK